MCGIVGYIGKEEAAPILLDGLSKLEYRGYDSAGIAVFDGEKINVAKTKGRLKHLASSHTMASCCRVHLESGIPGGRHMVPHLIRTPILI